ncbi:MAG: DUF3347 domain-containing protein [Rhodothermaceae bacterium]|nr:DUF3347 domain-containing protein [Rhodothermaceae bacterium]
MHRFLLASALLLAGCAVSNLAVAPAHHPASATAPTPPFSTDLSALPPASQPDLPAPLRPDNEPPTGVIGRDHGQGDHEQSSRSTAPGDLSNVLDAYLALQEALASDQFDGLAAQAQAFDDAVVVLIAAPPEGDPHFWHSQMADTDAVRIHTHALAEAPDLATARRAFGELSLPFVELVQVLGVPARYRLVRFTCGMADAPEGGVWLQRGDDAQNPFFGIAMPTCGTSEGALPASGEHMQEGHDGH